MLNNEDKILSMLESLTISMTQVQEAQEATNMRIDKLEEATKKRFDEQEEAYNRRFDEQEEKTNKRFDELNKRFDEQEEAYNRRFDKLEAGLAETNTRLDGIEADVRAIMHQQREDSRMLKGVFDQVVVLTEYQTLAETKFEKIMSSP